MQRYSWNEAKRNATLADRALDFRDAPAFFDGRRCVHFESPRQGEARRKTTALIGGHHFTLVWMWRDEIIHVISMRRAHVKEIRTYRDQHGS